MKELIGKKVLVTCSNWFYGLDGKQYKVAYGTLKGIHEAKETLGFIPNRTHANWFIEIGNLFLTGCQVNYLIKADTVELGNVTDWNTLEKDGVKRETYEYEHPSVIYQAD